MATKQPILTEFDGIIRPNSSQEYDFDETPDDEAIKNAVTELGGMPEAEVKIYRCGVGKDVTFLYSIHPSEFRLDDIQKEYGSGKYRIYVFDENRKQVTNRSIKIEAKPSGISQVQNNQSNDIGLLAQSMMNSMSIGFQELGKLIVQARPAPFDPMQMQMQMMQQMVAMKQLLGGQENTGMGFQQGLEMFSKGLEMAKEINPTPSGETTTADLLMEAVKSFAPVIAQSAAQKMAQDNAAALAATNTPSHTPNNTHLLNAPQDKETMMKKYYLNMACKKAAQNADPALYAELVLDNLSEADILTLMSSPSPIQELAKIEPNVLKYPLWFSELFTQINELLTSPDNDDINMDNDLDTIPDEFKDALKLQQTTDNNLTNGDT